MSSGRHPSSNARPAIAVALSLFSAALATSGCGSSSRFMRPAEPPAPVAASAEQALIVFLRPLNYGRQEMVTVIDDRGHFVGQPNGRQYWMLLVPPGQYGFLALGENTDSVRATVEAGRIYFVMVEIGMGMWAPRAHVTALTSRDERWERLAQYLRESHQMRVDLQGGDASLDPADVQRRLAAAVEAWERYSAEEQAARVLEPADGITAVPTQ